MTMPDMPDILEIELTLPGIGIETVTPTVELDPDPAGYTVVAVVAPGPEGPQGPAGDGGFTHTQSTPAATWTISNTLGRYPASVLVVIGTSQVDADVEFPDTATVVITFASPQAGRAEII